MQHTSRVSHEPVRRPGYLLVVNWLIERPGGVNEVVLNLARELQASGAYDPVIAVATWDCSPQIASFKGIPVVNLRMRPPMEARSLLRVAAGFFATVIPDALSLAAFLRERNIAVANVHFPGLSAWMFLLLKRLGLYRGKVILSFHGADIAGLSTANGILRRAWRGLIDGADAVFACSKMLANEVRTFAPKASVHTVHNGFDPSLFGRRTSKLGCRNILHIGKFEHKKGQDILLQAFRTLLASGEDYKLVLIGASGPALSNALALIDQFHLQSRVEVHVDVPHDSIPEFMQAADVFVLPSRAEPFGIVLLEAGASGLPVVASHVGGIPELLEHERTALLVPPDDPVALAEAMRRILSDPELAAQLADAWHRKATSQWNWTMTCDRYLELIGTLDRPRLASQPNQAVRGLRSR